MSYNPELLIQELTPDTVDTITSDELTAVLVEFGYINQDTNNKQANA